MSFKCVITTSNRLAVDKHSGHLQTGSDNLRQNFSPPDVSVLLIMCYLSVSVDTHTPIPILIFSHKTKEEGNHAKEMNI